MASTSPYAKASSIRCSGRTAPARPRRYAGLLRPDAGTTHIHGIDALADPIAARRCVAWVSDEPMIYDKLTPLEYLEFVAGLWGVEANSGR
jgi:ABC-2 type transport system ATP-binding protein